MSDATVDPLYARSGIGVTQDVNTETTEGSEAETVGGENSSMDADKGAGEPASTSGDSDNDESKPSSGDTATDKGDKDGLQEQEKSGDAEKNTEADTIAEARRITELAKTDPAGLAKELGIDALGSRFAALAKQSAGLRRREQELKGYEQRVREAEELLTAVRQDPVAWADKHLGVEGYERWTAAILGKQGPESQLVDKLMQRIDGLEQKLAAAQQQPQASSNDAVYAQQAAEFWSAYRGEIQQPQYAELVAFIGDETEMQKEVMAVQEAALRSDRWLTPREILSTLSNELAERNQRLQKLPAKAPAVEGADKQDQTPQESKGSATVTSDMRSTVGRLSDDPEWDKLSDREQMRRIAAKYRAG